MEIGNVEAETSKLDTRTKCHLISDESGANIDFNFIAFHDNLLYVSKFFPFLFLSHIEKDVDKGCCAHLLRHPFFLFLYVFSFCSHAAAFAIAM
jgi:hypothetical protein